MPNIKATSVFIMGVWGKGKSHLRLSTSKYHERANRRGPKGSIYWRASSPGISWPNDLHGQEDVPMLQHSRTKVKILRCLSGGEWWTTPQVCEGCGLSLTNGSELLRRYHDQDLVNRERNPSVPKGIFYRITDVGLERLSYLSSNITQTSSAIANLAGLSGDKKRVLDHWIIKKLGACPINPLERVVR